MAQTALKEDLKAEIAAGRVVIVTGTGITNAATDGQLVDGYPVWGWGGLLKHGVWTLQRTHALIDDKKAAILNLQIDSNDIDFMVSAGETISSRLRSKSPGIYHRWLKDSVGNLKPTKTEIVKVLSQLSRLLATLNYDTTLDDILKRKPVSWRHRDLVEDVLRGKTKDAVLHLHGYFNDPESIVLGLREYERVVNDPHTQGVLRLFTLDRTLLFVGCRGTISDPNFSRLIQWAKPTLQDSTHRHFFLCREGDLAPVREDADGAPWLHALAYGAKYDDLLPFLYSLMPGKTVHARGRLASRPTIGVDRRLYAEAMRRKYRAPKLESLDVTSSYYRELDLWRVFVWQNTRACQEYLPQVLELPKEHARRLKEAEQIDGEFGTEFSKHEVDELRRSYVAQAPRSAQDLVDDPVQGRLVILGDPGSGKSSLLQALVRRWVDAFERGSPVKGTLPVLIELAPYAKSRNKGDRILNFFDFCAESDLAPWRFERDDLRQLLASGQACLYFDGLDEIFDPDLRAEVIQSIAHIGFDYPQVRVIVTSRVIGYKGEILRSAGFSHLMLQDLDAEQIERFLKKWHRDTYQPDEDIERKEKYDRLLQAISDSRAIRELAGNPLLLTMMAIVNRSQELPRDRAELYRQCSKLLLHRWKIEEALRADPVLREDRLAFDSEEKQTLLRRVARHMQEGPQGLAGNVIAADALEDVIVEATQSLVRSPVHQVARALINHLRERVYILCFLGAETYAFVHRTFLEFFCADDICLRFDKKKDLTETQLLKIFVEHSKDETWQEVLSLLAGMLDAGVVGRIVQTLLALTNFESANHAVFLAARCLSEVRRRSELSEAVIITQERLKELTVWDHAFYYEPWSNEADEVTEIRTKAVAAMVGIANDPAAIRSWLRDHAQSDEHWAVRQTCVQELSRGWKTDPDILIWLKVRAQSDEHWSVRQACVQELARVWKTDDSTLPWLRGYMQSEEHWALRQACIQELARGWKTDSDILAWLKYHAQNDEHWIVRQTCAQELARGWKTDPDILPLLKDRARNDLDTDVRQTCVQELVRGWKTDPDILPLLKESVQNDEDEDDNGGSRLAYVQELARGWKTHPETFSFLKYRAQNDEHRIVRQACVQELARGWKTHLHILSWLKEIARYDIDPGVRQACAHELVRGWKADPDILSILKDRSQNDENWAVRGTCIQELARGWKTDPDILPWLKNCAENDDDWMVRDTCIV